MQLMDRSFTVGSTVTFYILGVFELIMLIFLSALLLELNNHVFPQSLLMETAFRSGTLLSVHFELAI